MTRYYEDIMVGERHQTDDYTITESEIIKFAERYDPQPFHTDSDAAHHSMFDGRIASGWHTALICMRLLYDEVLSKQAVRAGRGIDDLRWNEPVRPGDTIQVNTEIIEKTRSQKNPGIGIVRSKLDGVNQDGVNVVSWVAIRLLATKD